MHCADIIGKKGHFMKQMASIVLLVTSLIFAGDVYVKESRGEYLLDFMTTYSVPVQIDIETLIEFPAGYIPTFVLAGSDHLISAEVVQKAVYVTKASRERFSETSLTIHVQCPDGRNRKVLFKVVGNTNNKVYAIHFQEQGYNELNQAIQEVKARYTEQLKAAVSSEERRVTLESFNSTISRSIPLFFKKHRKRIKVTEKGATAWIEGVINCDSESFIYVLGSVKNGPCDVIKLKSVSIGKGRIPCELMNTSDLMDGYLYIYKMTALPFSLAKKVKKTKVKFVFEIWSKEKVKKAKIS